MTSSKNIEEEIKTELKEVDSVCKISEILYNKSRKCDNIEEYMKILKNIEEYYEKMKKNISLYLSSCKEVYNRYKNKDKDNYDYFCNPIIGYGSINVTKEGNKLKITLECE